MAIRIEAADGEGRAAELGFVQKCANSKLIRVAVDVFQSTRHTAYALPKALFSAFIRDENQFLRFEMERDAFERLTYASDIFNRIFEREDGASVGIVVPRVRAKLWSWVCQTKESLKAERRGIYALAIIALSVAHVADAIIGVTVGIASVATARHFDSINQIADRAFCGWTRIVRDTVFCALRVLRPTSGLNPLITGPQSLVDDSYRAQEPLYGG